MMRFIDHRAPSSHLPTVDRSIFCIYFARTQLKVKSGPRTYVEQYQIVPKVGLSTSGRNLGTLYVTNGFLRTRAYVIISISFAAPPKKISMPNQNHPSFHCDHGSRRIAQRLYYSSSATRPNAPKLAHDEVDTPNYIILQFHSHRSIFRP